MENDKENVLNEINNERSKKVFKLELNGQSIKGNKKFTDWENKMKEELGNDAKLYKCIHDNIYYFSSDWDLRASCPLCHRLICYFCSRYTNHYYEDNGKCCIVRRTYWIIFQGAYTFIKPRKENDGNYCFHLKIFLAPVISLWYFIFFFSAFYFHDMFSKNSKSNHGDSIHYCEYFKASTINTINIFNYAFAFFLSIPFIIIETYIKIIIKEAFIFISTCSFFFGFLSS